MNRKQLLSLILKPIKGIDYFIDYFNLVEQINVMRNKKYLSSITLMNSIVLLNTVHLVYLSFWSGGSALENAVNFDAFFVMIGKQKLNLLAAAASIMLLYYNRLLYIKTNYSLLRMLNAVIVHNDWRSFFIGSKFNNQFVCARTRKCYLITVNLFICVIASFEFFIVTSFLYFVVVFVKYAAHLMQNETSIFGAIFWIICGLLSEMFFCLSLATFFLNFSHSVANNFSITISLLMMFYLKMQQVYALLIKIVFHSHKKVFPLRHYILFRRSFVKNLDFFFAINRFHGRLFYAFLVTYAPIDIFLCMWIIQDKLDLKGRLFVYFWIAYVCDFVFVFHYIFTLTTKHIHKPAKLLFTLIFKPNRVDKRTRIHISHSIVALNTKNRYGFTYGNFGLVSLNTFAKFLLLYGKFCMITYKLMKNEIID